MPSEKSLLWIPASAMTVGGVWGAKVDTTFDFMINNDPNNVIRGLRINGLTSSNAASSSGNLTLYWAYYPANNASGPLGTSPTPYVSFHTSSVKSAANMVAHATGSGGAFGVGVDWTIQADNDSGLSGYIKAETLNSGGSPKPADYNAANEIYIYPVPILSTGDPVYHMAAVDTVLPRHVDKSAPLYARVIWRPRSDFSGDVVWRLKIYYRREQTGSYYGYMGSVVSDTPTASAPSPYGWSSTGHTFTISSTRLNPGDPILLSIERLVTSGSDTLPGLADLLGVELYQSL